MVTSSYAPDDPALCCPLQGYLLSSVRRKLKAHLIGRPGAEIAALKQGGEVSATIYMSSINRALKSVTLLSSLTDWSRTAVRAGH
jgi:hypothetical protein